jgi:hypothetical protein
VASCFLPWPSANRRWRDDADRQAPQGPARNAVAEDRRGI